MTEQKQEIKLDIEGMRKNKVFLATPMYGGMCHGMYTKSLMDTTSVCMQHGLYLQIYYMVQMRVVGYPQGYSVQRF